METKQPDATSKTKGRPAMNWFVILGWLVGPAILALIGAWAKVPSLAVGSPLGGGLIGGVVFGGMMARRFGTTVLSRVLVAICCAAIFGCVTLGLGFFGCALGGFNLDLR